MNRKITRLACGAKCGGLAASGPRAPDRSWLAACICSPSSPASASAPNPALLARSSSRRERRPVQVGIPMPIHARPPQFDVDEFVRRHHRLAEALPGEQAPLGRVGLMRFHGLFHAGDEGERAVDILAPPAAAPERAHRRRGFAPASSGPVRATAASCAIDRVHFSTSVAFIMNSACGATAVELRSPLGVGIRQIERLEHLVQSCGPPAGRPSAAAVS